MTTPYISDPNEERRKSLQLVELQKCDSSRCVCAISARRGFGLTHALCHDDPGPSMNVSVTGGRLKVHCHAGCDQSALWERVLLALGGGCRNVPATDRIEARIREKSNGAGPPTGTSAHYPWDNNDFTNYDYIDTDGAIRMRVRRWNNPKDFRQLSPSATYRWNFDVRDLDLEGWRPTVDGVELIPFHLPQLLAADPAAWIVIVEGEKDVLAAEGIGWVATCSPMGAGKWRTEYVPWFRDRNVSIIPDDDKPGHDHADVIASSLYGIAREVKIVRLPNPNGVKGYDLSDWIADGRPS